jgi:hypothetical protein
VVVDSAAGLVLAVVRVLASAVDWQEQLSAAAVAEVVSYPYPSDPCPLEPWPSPVSSKKQAAQATSREFFLSGG